MHGAAILYNALLAERCVALGLDGHGAEATEFRSRFDRWRQAVAHRRSELLSWDLADFWQLVLDQRPGTITLSLVGSSMPGFDRR